MTNTTSLAIILSSAVFFIIVDLVFGGLRKKGTYSMNEMGVNIFSFLNFMAIRTILITFYSWLLITLFPGGKGLISGLNFWVVFASYVLFEEYVHYWIHRLSHSIPWLWRLHKPHHIPKHVNLSVAFRENWLWFVIIPNTLFGAFLVWGGQPEAAFAAVAWKGASEFMVHSSTRWDLKLHNFWLTKPFMRVLEIFITLPDTHHAHHGIGKYGHGMCNFGSFLFIFDVLHKTAEFPHHKQEMFGVPERVKIEPWYQQLWWPLAKNKEDADLLPPTQTESQDKIIVSDNAKVSISFN